MLAVAIKLVLLAASLALPLAALIAAWRRAWRGAAAADVLLAALVSVPVLLLLEIVALHLAPVARPLDHLLIAHLGVNAAAGVAVWRLRDQVRGFWAELRDGAAAGWREAGAIGRAIVVLGVAGQLTALAYGAWESPWTWDERSYHIPQAVQPYQDGRLGRVPTGVQWADSYPRGATLLFFSTLRLTGTDAGFHATSAVMGFVFMAAVYAAARRMGIGRGWSLIAAGVTPSAPIFFYLSTIGYIDLIVGAVGAGVIALALPERSGRWGWGSAAACLMAVALALTMKVTPAPLVAALLGIRVLCPPDGAGPRWRRSALFAAAGAGALVLASPSYVRAWITYGSPTYPQELRIGPLEVFPGPMWAGSYLPVEVHVLTWQQKWVAGWTDWFTWLQVDSLGGFGPLFALAMAPAAAVCALGWAWAGGPRRTGWAILAASFWMVLLIPAGYVPRYAMWILLPGAVCAARLGELVEGRAPERAAGGGGRGWAAALLVMQAANLLFVQRCFVPALRQHLDRSEKHGVPLLTRHRTRPLHERWERMEPHGPTPATRRALYETMGTGERLVTAVYGWFATFYDPDYRYAVEHRPVRSWGYEWPVPGAKQYPLPEGPAWLEGLKRDGIAAAMVYRDSPEDFELAREGSGFRLAYEQRPEDGVVIRIYRREGRADGGR